MMMKSYRGYIGFFIFICVLLSLAACNKQTMPTTYTGLKSVVSDDAQRQNARGLALAEKALYRDAIVAYKDAIFKAPAFADAYENCGKACYAVGDYDMAMFYHVRAKAIRDFKENLNKLVLADEEQ